MQHVNAKMDILSMRKVAAWLNVRIILAILRISMVNGDASVIPDTSIRSVVTIIASK